MEFVSIGIDVSKATLTIAVVPSGDTWTSETTPSAVETLVTLLTTHHPSVIVVEATGCP